MKKLILAALIAGGAPFAAPARAAAPDRQDTRQSWEDFRIRARMDLAILDDKIVKLERDAKSARADGRDRLQSQAKTLREKKTDADRMMNRLATATAEARRDLQMKLDRAVSDLKKAVHKAEAKPRDRT
jgi:hypothetical protein